MRNCIVDAVRLTLKLLEHTFVAMRVGWWCALAAVGAPLPARVVAAEPHHAVRLELGVASPTGAVGARYSLSPGLRGDTSVAIGVGLAYTGLGVSAALEQPLLWLDTNQGPSHTRSRLLAYGGYSAGLLERGLHHPLAADRDNRFLPDGSYHFIDVGVMIEAGHGPLGPVYLLGGVGISVLVASPDLPPLQPDDDATFLNAEWWFHKGAAPSLWAGVGWRL